MKQEGIKNKISATMINDKMLKINVMKDKLAIHPVKFNFFSQAMLNAFVKKRVVADNLYATFAAPGYLCMFSTDGYICDFSSKKEGYCR